MSDGLQGGAIGGLIAVAIMLVKGLLERKNGNGYEGRIASLETEVHNHAHEITSLRERWHKVGNDAMSHLLAQLEKSQRL